MARFSIIIPTYNRASTITRAVESVLQQKFKDWELIIIDDGSNDHTRKILERYLKDERIVYKYQNQAGVSAARNRGLNYATGQYIIFLDSDDELYPQLTQDLAAYKIENYDLVFWYVKKLKKNTEALWKPQKLEKLYNEITATFLSGSVCYRKDLLINIEGFDEILAFGENYEMGIRLTQAYPEMRTKIIPKVYLNYYLDLNNSFSREPRVKLQSLKYLLNKHVENYKKDSYSYSRLLYQIGFLYEKIGDNYQALKYFEKAHLLDYYYLKPMLKKLLYKVKYFNN